MGFSADLYLLFITVISPAYITCRYQFRNSVLLHDVYCRVCETQVFHMSANAAVLLHFVAIMPTYLLIVQVVQKIFSEVSPF